MLKRLKKYGFTLSEVLITMGILGVIAALVTPALNLNFQRKIFVSELQTAYNEIANAVEHVIQTEGVERFSETSIFSNRAGIHNEKVFLLNNFNTLKSSCHNDGVRCIPNSYKNLNKKNIGMPIPLSSVYCIQTKKGAAICMGGYEIYVDVNAEKNPNIYGRDLFYMQIDDNGRVYSPYSSSYCSGTNGMGCLTKIIEDDWYMKY